MNEALPMDMPLFMANRVLDNVFVGGCYAAEDEDFLLTNSIVKVINCCSHQFANRYQGAGIKYLSFQFAEDGGSTMFDPRDETITQVVRFVNEAIEKDECVLVHSMNGDSRSVCILAGYLVHRFHWPPHRAITYIATKRFSSKPNGAYLAQLREFAARRRAKYGEFKDIFGVTKGLKLNNQEVLHRNTFLNATKTQPDPEVLERTKSVREILDEYLPEAAEQPEARGSSILQMRPARPAAKGPRRVTWRDGLITAQIPSSYSNFDANGRPLGSQTSTLFRPRTPSYRGSQQVRCIPVRMDQALIPAVSFDVDLPSHRRRPDGYLSSASPSLDGYAVIARPVSILAKVGRGTRSQYDSIAIYVSKQDFEAELARAMAERDQERAPRPAHEGRRDAPTSLSSTTGAIPGGTAGGYGLSNTYSGTSHGSLSSTTPAYPGEAQRPSSGQRQLYPSGPRPSAPYSTLNQARRYNAPSAPPLRPEAGGRGGAQAGGQGGYPQGYQSGYQPGYQSDRFQQAQQPRSGQLMRVRPPTPPRRLDEEPARPGPRFPGLSSTLPAPGPEQGGAAPRPRPAGGHSAGRQPYSPGARPASQDSSPAYAPAPQPGRPSSAASHYGQQSPGGGRPQPAPRPYSGYGGALSYSQGYQGYSYGERPPSQRASSVSRAPGGSSFGSRYSGP